MLQVPVILTRILTEWEPIHQDIVSSPFHSVMVDETTEADLKN
jgi:hypothetical protein